MELVFRGIEGLPSFTPYLSTANIRMIDNIIYGSAKTFHELGIKRDLTDFVEDLDLSVKGREVLPIYGKMLDGTVRLSTVHSIGCSRFVYDGKVIGFRLDNPEEERPMAIKVFGILESLCNGTFKD